MEHRHLQYDAPSVAAVESVLERGSDAQFRDLVEAVRDDPWGEWAEASLDASGRSEVYGRPVLLRLVVERGRQVSYRG